MQYYRLTLDVNIPGAWYLADIVNTHGDEILASEFMTGRLFEQNTDLLVIPNVVGKPLDFRPTAFGVPIVSKDFADTVERFDNDVIQRIPVTVGSVTSGYEILNILRMLECLDYEQTHVERYIEEASSPPGKLGQIRGLANIRIRPELATGNHIFWLAEWPVVIVVSELLKSALEEKGLRGMKFISV